MSFFTPLVFLNASRLPARDLQAHYQGSRFFSTPVCNSPEELQSLETLRRVLDSSPCRLPSGYNEV
ncbi:hypothetical protein LEP1GSC059_1115 [Leptospira noguchii serovar Panama str. CZ214]|uniref:Uncharacterized protein n=1 Tax=Leptospira noguchii serovar Panama str. CZ214 TaxID=1001595 RepID=T0FEX3_9LEPT|nr:hypothetical protein LEP1GSC059_1115 [Leptospira noguchii serovar Panama str. CZ214]